MTRILALMSKESKIRKYEKILDEFEHKEEPGGFCETQQLTTSLLEKACVC